MDEWVLMPVSIITTINLHLGSFTNKQSLGRRVVQSEEMKSDDLKKQHGVSSRWFVRPARETIRRTSRYAHLIFSPLNVAQSSSPRGCLSWTRLYQFPSVEKCRGLARHGRTRHQTNGEERQKTFRCLHQVSAASSLETVWFDSIKSNGRRLSSLHSPINKFHTCPLIR